MAILVPVRTELGDWNARNSGSRTNSPYIDYTRMNFIRGDALYVLREMSACRCNPLNAGRLSALDSRPLARFRTHSPHVVVAARLARGVSRPREGCQAGGTVSFSTVVRNKIKKMTDVYVHTVGAEVQVPLVLLAHRARRRVANSRLVSANSAGSLPYSRLELPLSRQTIRSFGGARGIRITRSDRASPRFARVGARSAGRLSPENKKKKLDARRSAASPPSPEWPGASLCSRKRSFPDEVPVLVARRVRASLPRDDWHARMLPVTSTKRLPRRLFIPVAAVQSVSQFARHFRAHGLLKVREREDDCEGLT